MDVAKGVHNFSVSMAHHKHAHLDGMSDKMKELTSLSDLEKKDVEEQLAVLRGEKEKSGGVYEYQQYWDLEERCLEQHVTIHKMKNVLSHVKSAAKVVQHMEKLHQIGEESRQVKNIYGPPSRVCVDALSNPCCSS